MKAKRQKNWIAGDTNLTQRVARRPGKRKKKEPHGLHTCITCNFRLVNYKTSQHEKYRRLSISTINIVNAIRDIHTDRQIGPGTMYNVRWSWRGGVCMCVGCLVACRCGLANSKQWLTSLAYNKTKQALSNRESANTNTAWRQRHR